MQQKDARGKKLIKPRMRTENYSQPEERDEQTIEIQTHPPSLAKEKKNLFLLLTLLLSFSILDIISRVTMLSPVFSHELFPPQWRFSLSSLYV